MPSAIDAARLIVDIVDKQTLGKPVLEAVFQKRAAAFERWPVEANGVALWDALARTIRALPGRMSDRHSALELRLQKSTPEVAAKILFDLSLHSIGPRVYHLAEVRDMEEFHDVLRLVFDLFIFCLVVKSHKSVEAFEQQVEKYRSTIEKDATKLEAQVKPANELSADDSSDDRSKSSN